MAGRFWEAMALMLVFEGLLPFLAPQAWKDAMRRLTALDNGRLRGVGLALMIAGLLVVVG